MYKAMKKILSLLLAVTMLFSTALTAVAAETPQGTATTINPLNLGASKLEMKKSAAPQEAEICFFLKENAELGAYSVSYSFTDTSGAVVLGEPIEKTNSDSFEFNSSKKRVESYNEDFGFYGVYSEKEDGYVLFTIPVTIKENVEGTFGVDFTVDYVTDYAEKDYTLASDSVTATIEVKEPAASTADYEIYYTLDKADGTDADKYHEYGIGDDVVATIKLKNNTANALTLQAYDIYLDVDYTKGLKFKSSAMTGAVALIDDSNTDQSNTAGAAVTHIEAVSDTYKNSTATKTLPANGELTLGTITFTIDSANAEVKYGTPLDIGFKVAADATNTAKAEDVTNFSVGGATEGDKVSYYPMETDDILGAEVNTTYTVQFNANGGTFGDAWDNMEWLKGDEVQKTFPYQTKEYNNPLTLTDKVPTRDNYSFLGWSTNEKETVATYTTTNNSYTANEATTLYAVWKQNTVTVIWYNGNGGTLKEETIESGTVPTAPAENPVKEGNAQYSYTFDGWALTDGGAKITNFTAVTENTTFYPLFTETVNKYKVTFVDEDGTTVLKEAAEYAYGTKADDIVKPDDPTKDATAQYTYTFAGWNPEIKDVTGDVTYKATYTATLNEYTIKFADEDGTTVLKQGKYAYGTTADKIEEPDAPTKAAENGYSYTFASWSPAIVDVTGDATYKATYTPKAIQYTITLDPNGDDVAVVEADGWSKGVDGKYTKEYTVEDAIALPEATLSGKSFGGWQLEANAEGWTAGNYRGTVEKGNYGNVELKAVWTDKPLSVEGSGVNGTVTVSNADIASGSNADEGDTINITLTPANGYEYTNTTKVQYIYTNDEDKPVTVTVSKGENDAYSFVVPDDVKNVDGTDITVNVTFTAINYTISYDLNGGTTATNNPVTYTIESDDIALVAPTKEGYTFAGWTGTGLTAATKDVTIAKGSTGDRTYTATWTADEYTITYELDGGAVDGANPVKYTIESADITLVNPTKTGYTFAGWTGTDLTEATKNVTIAKGSIGDRTYIATWTADTYTVTLNANGGKINDKDTDTITATYDDKFALTDPVCEGYEFKGWYTDVEDESTKIEDGDTVKITGDTTLTAKWEAKQYTITFVDTDGTTKLGEITAAYKSEVTKPTDPTKNGYTFDKWVVGDNVEVLFPVTMPLNGMTVKATWNTVDYTIKFMDGETELTNLQMSYNIESTDKLPTYDKANYDFVKWEVTAPDGNWEAGATINADTAVTGKYGNVTLTAQWTREAIVKVEQYKYADNGQWLLRVSDNLKDSSKTYQLDGQDMFYMSAADDTNKAYLVNDNDTGVFYALIDAKYVDATDTSNVKLTDDAFGKLEGVEGNRVEINYNGDINGDGVLNIADANVVYQMVQKTGTYYAGDLLSPEQRLMADMDRAKANNDHRGSLEDVQVIVNKINGVTTTNG